MAEQIGLCWSCRAPVEPQDNYCRRCGNGQGDRIPWYYRPWGIVVATLLGLGPFGLMLVWRSPRLTPGARWAWTAGILALTGWTLMRLYELMLTLQAMAAVSLQGLGL